MSEKEIRPDGPALADVQKFAANILKIGEQSRQLLGDFLLRHAALGGAGPADPLNIGVAFQEMITRMISNPARIIEAQIDLWQRYFHLWHHTTQRFFGGEVASAADPAPDDRRFVDAAWNDNLIFDFVKQSYLLSARWLQRTVEDVEGLDEKTRQKVDFYTRQFVDALSPTNFVLTNPQVLRATLASSGDNLVKGLDALLQDLDRGQGKLSVRMTDTDAFILGKNVAVSPGKVIYRNDLAELIQYQPTTKQVFQRPLLIIPPWINKFYILDLRPENSFIKWAVDQGYTVFVLSWINPDAKLAHKTFEDYMFEGILAALDAIEKSIGAREVTAIGYCLGGTLLATTLGYMAAKNDTRITAATFFAAQADFSEPGEIAVFIDEEQLKFIEEMMQKRGYLDGGEMATTFNMLRANDLIWSFVINNYLLGRDPFPFDLLFWNSDSTRMPAAMHSYYLRNMYQRNLLAKPNGLTLANVPIDLSRVKIPMYIQAAKDDHIAPWRSVFKMLQSFSGPMTFMLAGSGHIAGVVNPPAAKKYQYWLNTSKAAAATPDEWLQSASEFPGSWWPHWHGWLAEKSGPKVPARDPAKGNLKPLADAPGTYVLVRNDAPAPVPATPTPGANAKAGKSRAKAET